MSTTAVIGLGILVWVLLAVSLALFMGRMIQLRDRQHPDRTPPVEELPSEGEWARAASWQSRPWEDLRNDL